MDMNDPLAGNMLLLDWIEDGNRGRTVYRV